MGIQIGSLLIPYYGLCIALGIVVAAVVGYINVKVFKLNIYDFIIIAAMVALGGIVGAKALYLLVSWKSIDFTRLTDSKYFSALMGGGFVFYGGLIGGLLMLIICRKYFRISVNKYVPVCIACVPIVHGFGRIGCALVGCCYGKPYKGVCSIVYNNSPFAPNNVSLFPVQAVEAFCNIIIAIILLLCLYMSKCMTHSNSANTGKRLYNSGYYMLALYILMYAPVRFILEFFRYDYIERGFLWGMSTSQWISIGAVIVSVIFVICYKGKGIQSEITIVAKGD